MSNGNSINHGLFYRVKPLVTHTLTALIHLRTDTGNERYATLRAGIQDATVSYRALPLVTADDACLWHAATGALRQSRF